MASLRNAWDRAWQHVVTPKVSDERLSQSLQQIRHQLPAPVFWLLGKAQSGKTSIIRGLTGSTRGQIGNGFRACTRTAQLYPFPNEQECLVQFLDTRGLGEVAYDPTDDLHVLEGQAHCLVVVMKAMDHAQQSVLEPLDAILKAHPDWPLLVVQTTLHEGYPGGRREHPLPYPFAADPLPPSVPNDLVRSLLSQRQMFVGGRARFVAIDFTLSEDGYEPELYGLDALWNAIEEAMPLGLRAMLQGTSDARRWLRDVYFRTAHPHVLSYALAAGLAASVPVPLIDIPVFMAIQAKLFHTLASIYGQENVAPADGGDFRHLGNRFFSCGSGDVNC